MANPEEEYEAPMLIAEPPLDEELTARVEAHLNALLEDPLFAQSRRSTTLLRFIVQEALRGTGRSGVKERVLGSVVFGRDADYDTNSDPVVRMAAGEVRKKLAQFYYSSGAVASVRIDLPSGTYLPRFLVQNGSDAPIAAATAAGTTGIVDEASAREERAERMAAASAFPTEQVTAAVTMPVLSRGEGSVKAADAAAISDRSSEPWLRRGWKPWAVAALGSLIVLAVLLLARRASPVERFWQNYLESGHTVTMVLPEVQGNAVQPGRLAQRGMPISFADAESAAAVGTRIVQHGGQFALMLSSAATLDGLRAGPTVLVGSMTNPWTMRFSQSLPYYFDRSADSRYGRIVNRSRPSDNRWVQDFSVTGASLEQDYGLIAAFQDPTTEVWTIVIAGISRQGTRAAGEAISNPKHLDELLRKRARGKENFAAVISTEVVNGQSGPPHVLEMQSW